MNETPVSRLDIEAVSAPSGLRLRGEIDAHTVTALQEALGSLATDGDVTVDMAKVEFVDSTGLRVLVSHHQLLADAGHRLVLLEPSDAVRSLLDMTGLTGTLNLGSAGSAGDGS